MHSLADYTPMNQVVIQNRRNEKYIYKLYLTEKKTRTNTIARKAKSTENEKERFTATTESRERQRRPDER